MAHTIWTICNDSYRMTEFNWTAGTNNLAVVSTAAGTAFRTSFWSSTVFTGAYIFTDTAKIWWEKFISTNSEWSHCRLQWICNKSLGDFEQKNSKLVIMIHNILSSKFHFQKWWSGFCFRKTRSVTFPKFQRKKLWPGTQYFCLDFVSVNHTRWRSQIRIFKIFLDFVSVKHGGWFPNFWILFPWFANKG